MGSLRLTLVLLAVSLSNGCTLKTYPGPELPAHELAHLAPALDTHRSVYLERIDDEPVGLFEDRASLLPGRHRVLATLALRVGGRRVEGTQELMFDAEPGCEYRVRGAWSLYGAHLWITDEADGRHVADRSASPRRLPPVAAGR